MDLQTLLEELKGHMNTQTTIITESITKNILEVLDDKLKGIIEENQKLKNQVTNLEEKLISMEKQKRKNNLLFFGIEEKRRSELELVEYIKEITEEIGFSIDSHEIQSAFRLGKPDTNKKRPVLVTFSTTWKKYLIFKNKRQLPPNIYVSEDFPKDVLEKRKILVTKQEEERKKGNLAYIKYDKLIIKEKRDTSREKRKRQTSESPISPSTRGNNQKTSANPKKVNKSNILQYVNRERSNSFSETSKNYTGTEN